MTTADPVEILSRLAAGRVDFIVVGMAAGILRGAPLTTADLGIVHGRHPENVSRLLGVLGGLDALATTHGDLDCLGTIGDGQTYEDLLARAPELELRPALPVLRATLAETLKRP